MRAPVFAGRTLRIKLVLLLLLMLFLLLMIVFSSKTAVAGTLAETFYSFQSQEEAYEELDKLSQYELVILVDSSKSMLKTDCTNSADHRIQSRWEWLKAELPKLQTGLASINSKLKILSFSNRLRRYPRDDFLLYSEILDPNGGTNTAGAVQEELNAFYEKCKTVEQKDRKPLLLVILSDCVPDDQASLRGTIIRASKKMKYKEELKIVFLQVGQDRNACRLLKDLDAGLLKRKAQYDIVSTMNFSELQGRGLKTAISQLVNQ